MHLNNHLKKKKACYIGSVFEEGELLIFLHSYSYHLLNEQG